MRAARILQMLLILQQNGRRTAGQLAAELEVSERTIRRDVEALSEAGVPIYAVPGADGGIELLDRFRTNLTGFTTDEVRALFLAGQPRLAHRLGEGAPARAAEAKLVGALGEGWATEAASLGQVFHHDPDPWDGDAIPHGELRRLTGAVRRRRQVELRFADGTERAVRPLGVVLKAGDWFVVDATEPPDVVALDGLRALRLTRHRFEPPVAFDLPSFWRAEGVGSRRKCAPEREGGAGVSRGRG